MNYMQMVGDIGLGLKTAVQQQQKAMLVIVISWVGVLRRIFTGVIQMLQRILQRMNPTLMDSGMLTLAHSISIFMRSFPAPMPQPIPDTLLRTTMVRTGMGLLLTKRYTQMYGLLCLARISTME